MLNMGFDPFALTNPKSQADAILLLEEAQRCLEQLHEDLLEIEKQLIASRQLSAELDKLIKVTRTIKNMLDEGDASDSRND